MATAEDTARLEARIEQMENTMMLQSGALSSAREEAEAHRVEMTKMLKDLHDTVAHTAALKDKLKETAVPDLPPCAAPPGFEDPLQHEDAWAFWRGKGGGGGKGKGSGGQEGGDLDRLIAKAVQQALADSSGLHQPTEARTFSDSKFRKLEERNFRRVSTFTGKVEDWAEWAFAFKAASRGSVGILWASWFCHGPRSRHP